MIAAAFVALNPFMIWYSQEARAHVLLAALTGASFLWFVRARREPSARNLAWWAIWSSLALMTHFFAGFAIAPEAVWLLWIARTRLVAAAVAVVALVQGVMLPIAGADTDAWSRVDREDSPDSPDRFDDPRMGGEHRPSPGDDHRGARGGAIFLLVVTLLLVLAGDKQTRAEAKVGAAIAAFVMLVPLALAALGQDYFLSRNLIPALVPLTTVVAAACVAPRARVLGGAFAIALLSMFAVAAATVQTEPRLERSNWRAVAHAIGPTAVPRAILYAGGDYADPLKIYVPHVDWIQPSAQEMRIQEIDLVGAPKWLPPISRRAPEATRLLGYKLTTGTAINRYALRHPITTSINVLVELAPHLFRRDPGPLLVFFEQPSLSGASSAPAARSASSPCRSMRRSRTPA